MSARALIQDSVRWFGADPPAEESY